MVRAVLVAAADRRRWCLRASGERRLAPALCMALFSVSMPAWWGRFDHAALTSHFLLLFGLGTYFILIRPGGLQHWIGATGLLCLTLTVHPYLFVMNTALILAAPVTLLARRTQGWPAAFGYAAGALAVSAAAIWALGYLGGPVRVATDGCHEPSRRSGRPARGGSAALSPTSMRARSAAGKATTTLASACSPAFRSSA